MQIKEVEARVGVTRKNIRFYEKEGLLAPRRQAGNGYRDYTEEEVARLERIKLLRKLDVPLEEIAAMLDGRLTLAQGMRRHLVTLEHRQDNLATARALSERLVQEPGLLEGLDAGAYLSEMAALERKGVRFVNVKKQDKKQRTRGALLAAGTFLGLMALLEALMAWALCTEPAPLPIALLVLGIPPVFVVGALLALRQRLREIERSEIDAYREY
ncbi:MAG TPA: MerR family transcriptional regulator [Candidatus Gemmiger avium]|nr:MerR family transcriptional regulator [Candidatus Gemmiger avium]